MTIETTPIKGLLIYTPKVFQDDRGYFLESYNKEKLARYGISANFIQDNQSFSTYGTFRGLHFQTGDCAQTKLVRVTHGSVLDVAVDLRTNSETFGKSYSIELSSQNHKQLYIPRGFAHGFSVLSKEAIFQYKVDNIYNKDSESGIIFNDSELNIDWKIAPEDISTSTKDNSLLSFLEIKRTL